MARFSVLPLEIVIIIVRLVKYDEHEYLQELDDGESVYPWHYPWRVQSIIRRPSELALISQSWKEIIISTEYKFCHWHINDKPGSWPGSYHDSKVYRYCPFVKKFKLELETFRFKKDELQAYSQGLRFQSECSLMAKKGNFRGNTIDVE